MKILLSIKPDFAKKIFKEEKKFEYRKSIPKGIKEVVVYASSPIKKIIGSFTVKKVLENTPQKIWKNTQQFAGISKAFFDKYYRGKEIALAIEIDKIKKFSIKKELSEYQITTPPQSFCYLNT